jgi:hypothetical protein
MRGDSNTLSEGLIVCVHVRSLFTHSYPYALQQCFRSIPTLACICFLHTVTIATAKQSSRTH